MRTTTIERNREIFAGFRAGKSVSKLAELYGLTPTTIAALIRVEGHKLEVNVDDFYCDLRRSLGVQLWVNL
jgi:Mor family transcriptional regulator